MSEDDLRPWLARLDERLGHLDLAVRELGRRLEGGYVTRDAFDPVRRVVHGLVALLLGGVGAALVALVLRLPDGGLP